MLDAFWLVAAQVAALAALSALSGGVLGWLIGRRHRQHPVTTLEPAPAPPYPAVPPPSAFIGQDTGQPAMAPDQPEIDLTVPVSQPDQPSTPSVASPENPFADTTADSDPITQGYWAQPTGEGHEPPTSTTASAVIGQETGQPENAALLPVDSPSSPEMPTHPDPASTTVTTTPEDTSSNALPEQAAADHEPDSGGASTQDQETDPDPGHDTPGSESDPGESPQSRIAELERLLAQREHQLMSLEAGATAAWDTTVPTLENLVAELREENTLLRDALGRAESRVEDIRAELELVQRIRQSHS